MCICVKERDIDIGSVWWCHGSLMTSYLQSVCSEEFLCGRCWSSSCCGVGSGRHSRAARHQHRCAGQDLCGHQPRRHWAQVRIKRSGGGCCSSCTGVGCKAWRDRKHRLKQTENNNKWNWYSAINRLSVSVTYANDMVKGQKISTVIWLLSTLTKSNMTVHDFVLLIIIIIFHCF